ncbi:MAG: AIR synthase related protein, partial [Syntrophothermus sp.]
TDDGMLRIKENGEVVAEVPARSLSTDGAPVYRPEAHRPAYLDELWAFDWRRLPEPEDLGAALLKLLSAPTIASKEWVYRQYDYMVQTNTVVGPGSDAAVLRVRGTKKAIALTIDANGRYCHLDPFTGSQIAVAEAARNLVCTGGTPLAVTDGLNFGNPEKPEIYWQLTRSVEGIASACRELETPVVGGNASMYNETNGEAIYPTPVIGMVGLLEDVERRCTSAFKSEGDRVILLGPAGEELGGSEYLKQAHGVVAGRPPALDLDMEKRVQQLCLAAIRKGLLNSAHDCAEGGLAVALAECCIGGNIGVSVRLPYWERADAALFGESQSRIVVSVPPEKLHELRDLAEEHRVPVLPLGRVGGAGLRIELEGPLGPAPKRTIQLPLEAMVQNWRDSIAGCMKK